MATVKPNDIAAEIASFLNDRRFGEGGEGYYPDVETRGGFIFVTYADADGERHPFIIEIKAIDG